MENARRFLSLFALLGLTACATTASSPHIRGVLLIAGDGKPGMAVSVANPTDTPLWIRVSIEAPGPIQCGSGKTPLAAKGGIVVACSVAKVIPEHNYPVRVAVYLDDKLSVSAGTLEGTGRFRQSDVEWLRTQLKPLVFPLKMEGVVHSDSVSLFAAMGGTAGTLVVDERGLKYSNADKTLAIPAAQMRAVKPRIDRQHWIIIVEYQDADENKTAVFQRSYGRGTHEGLDMFMRGLMAVYKPKPVAPAQ